MSDGTPNPDQPPAARPARARGLARLRVLAGHLARFRRPAGLLASAGHLEYDRILFFSDAVFAIAITLLVVELPTPIEDALTHNVPINSGSQLRHAAGTGILGFGISFGVIGLFWMGHHGLFRYIKAFDRPLMLLNLLFLGTIAFLPYPTDLLSSVGNQKPAVVFYAACAGTAGLIETIMWFYASHARVGLVADVSPGTRRLILLRTGRSSVIFAISIVIAQFSPRAATYSWLGILAVGIVTNRLYGHHEAADPADVAGDLADVTPDPEAG